MFDDLGDVGYCLSEVSEVSEVSELRVEVRVKQSHVKWKPPPHAHIPG